TSAEGKWLAAPDGRVVLPNLPAGQLRLEVRASNPRSGHSAPVPHTWTVQELRLVETAVLPGHTGPVSSVAFSPDGTRIASGSEGVELKDGQRRDWGEVKVWDAQTGKEVLALKGHTGTVSSVAFSPDGERIASGSYDQTVRVWDAQSGQELLA